MNRTRLIFAVSFFLVTVLTAGLGFPRSEANVACGSPSKGLQICLTSVGTDLELDFRNVGDRDVTLNLGVMIANGKVQLPNRIVIKFTDAQGKTRLFKFGDKRYPVIAGRLDDYVVPLRVGSIYRLRLMLDEFWCQETKEFSIPLPSGNDFLTAQFEGTGAHAVNPDMPGIKLINFWLGTVESNVLTVRG